MLTHRVLDERKGTLSPDTESPLCSMLSSAWFQQPHSNRATDSDTIHLVLVLKNLFYVVVYSHFKQICLFNSLLSVRILGCEPAIMNIHKTTQHE